MHRASLGGVELEYESRGSGEPVVLVHHGAGRSWFDPLFEQPALVERYRLLCYHRAGYGGSSRLTAALTFDDEAETFRALMDHLHVQRAHVVGHSASGCIALHLALHAPARVHSLVLLEPALMVVPSPPEVPRALELYRAGDPTAAVETFLRGTCGPGCRPILEAAVPRAFDQALEDADTFFRHELPALRSWRFGREDAARVEQPVLAVLGEKSDVRFHERQRLLLEWLPNVEPFTLTGAGHLLHLENPEGLAAGMAAFLSRHGITTAR
jgi:pimeloyl-ACP methyl ester carboxylesterase